MVYTKATSKGYEGVYCIIGSPHSGCVYGTKLEKVFKERARKKERV